MYKENMGVTYFTGEESSSYSGSKWVITSGDMLSKSLKSTESKSILV